MQTIDITSTQKEQPTELVDRREEQPAEVVDRRDKHPAVMADRREEQPAEMADRQGQEEPKPADIPEMTPHFFKIILSPHASKLHIPNEFVKEHGANLGDLVFLEVPNGVVWKVKLLNSSGMVWLNEGWNKFKEYYSIACGYFLLFRYKGNSQFSVFIFDLSASEIEYPPGPNEDTTPENQCVVDEPPEENGINVPPLSEQPEENGINVPPRSEPPEKNGINVPPPSEQPEENGINVPPRSEPPEKNGINVPPPSEPPEENTIILPPPGIYTMEELSLASMPSRPQV